MEAPLPPGHAHPGGRVMPVGLLFATMEPPANVEEEFQDWYDT